MSSKAFQRFVRQFVTLGRVWWWAQNWAQRSDTRIANRIFRLGRTLELSDPNPTQAGAPLARAVFYPKKFHNETVRIALVLQTRVSPKFVSGQSSVSWRSDLGGRNERSSSSLISTPSSPKLWMGVNVLHMLFQNGSDFQAGGDAQRRPYWVSVVQELR